MEQNDAGVCSAEITLALPDVSDNCDEIPVVTNNHPSNIYPVGETLVTWSVTDASDNTNECVQAVMVQDTENPVINCNADISVNNDTDMCSTVIILDLATATDNCSTSPDIESDHLSSVYPVGTTIVTWTATDEYGNSDSCTQNVTVIDAQIPTITCADNVTVDNETGSCDNFATVVTPSHSDNCEISYIVNDYNGNSVGDDTYPVGTTAVVWTVEDVHGNTNECTQNVTVNDAELPTITCADNVVAENDDDVCQADLMISSPSVSDNCEVATVVNDKTGTNDASGIYPLGNTVVTWLVTDIHGNENECTQNVRVNDTQNPLIMCPADIELDNDEGNCSAVVTYDEPTLSDNCDAVTFALQPDLLNGDAFPIGVTVQTYRAIDGAGNTAECSFEIQVNDTELPTIWCPDDIMEDATQDVCESIVFFTPPFGEDNCSVTTFISAGLPSGSHFPVGVTTETFTARDAAGNEVECSFTITVEDNQAPAITCMPDISRANDTGVCGAEFEHTPIVANDNCPDMILNHVEGIGPMAFYPIGTTLEKYVAVDASGNSTVCEFSVTIIDYGVPTIVCPAPITVSNDLGECGAVVTYNEPTAIDNCNDVLITQVAGLESGSLFPTGISKQVFSVSDANDNTATCEFTVTVLDTELPSISCPSDISIEGDIGTCGAVVTYNMPVGEDNCEGIDYQIIAGYESGTSFPIGTTSVEWKVYDSSGNYAGCSFEVTVRDTEAPMITCPSDFSINNSYNYCGAYVELFEPSVADNCGIVTISQISGALSGTFIEIGESEVAFLATDMSGNTASCSYTITVLDNQTPLIICPENVELPTEEGICEAVATYAQPAAADNCSGVVTELIGGFDSGESFPTGTTVVSYSVSDVVGLSSMCDFTVTVIDTEMPVITCPNDIVINNLPGVCGATVSYDMPEVSDNCEIASTYLMTGLESGAFFDFGETVQSYKTVDASGNFAECTFLVTVNEETYFDVDITGLIANFAIETSDPNVRWYWDFGDQNYSNLQNPVHTYSMSRIYNVCVVAVNDVTGCQTVTCQDVEIGDVECNADFTSDISGYDVAFTDASTGDATRWTWVFGDGSSSDLQNPSHQYTHAGTFTVRLTIFNESNGCTSFMEEEIEVGVQTCDLNAAYTEFVDMTSLTIELSDESEGTGIASWMWYLGDGNTSTEQNPTHTYEQAGKYLLSLSVFNSDNSCHSYTEKLIQIGEPTCRAYFEYASVGERTIQFAEISENAHTVSWNFGDGTTTDANNPQHIYTADGLYEVSFTIVNEDNTCSDTYTEFVQIGEVPCSAYFTASVDGGGNQVFFDNESLGEYTSITWIFGDGYSSDENDPVHVYEYEGYYTVTLSTHNSITGCADSYQRVVLVRAEGDDCSADFNYIPDYDTRATQFFDNSYGNNISYFWNFGDGNTSEDVNPIHTYTSGTYYDVCLTVGADNDNDGNVDLTNTNCKTVQVADEESNTCYAEFINTINDYTVFFTDLSRGDIDTWRWTFGDELESTEQNPTHTYAQAGSYVVTLVVSNSETDCSSMFVQVVNVSTDGIYAGFNYVEGEDSKKGNGHPIDFFGSSGGGGSELSWDFGDGSKKGGELNYSTLRPHHVYATSGTYNVCLTVSDPVLDVNDTYCKRVTVGTTGVENVTNLNASIGTYPNPFSNKTTVSYSLQQASKVELAVYDVLGNKIQVLEYGKRLIGTYELEWDASFVKSGIYFLRLKTDKGSLSLKIVKSK